MQQVKKKQSVPLVLWDFFQLDFSLWRIWNRAGSSGGRASTHNICVCISDFRREGVLDVISIVRTIFHSQRNQNEVLVYFYGGCMK